MNSIRITSKKILQFLAIAVLWMITTLPAYSQCAGIPITASSVQDCSTGIVTVNATYAFNTPSPAIYEWKRKLRGTTSTFSYVYTSGNINTFDPSLYESVEIRAVYISPSCTSSTYTEILLHKLLTNPVFTPGLQVCTGLNAGELPMTFTIDGADGFSDFTWRASGTNSFIAGDINGSKNVPAGSLSFYITALNGHGCSTVYSYGGLSLPSTAPSLVSANSITICEGSSADMALNIPTNGYNINWYTVTSGSVETRVYTGHNATFNDRGFTFSLPTNLSPGTHKYRAKFSSPYNSNCDGPGVDIDVTVTARPAKPVVVLTYPASPVCPFSSIPLQIQSPVAGYTYEWYDATGTTLLGTGTAFSATSGASGTSLAYKVRAYASSTTGCRSIFADNTNSTVLTVAKQPTVYLTASNNGGFCANTAYNSNKTVLLTATFSHSTGGPSGFSIGWFKNGVLQGTCTTATSPATYTVNAPVQGDVWMVKVNEGNCTGGCFTSCSGCAAFATKTLADLTPTATISGCSRLSPDEVTTLTVSTSASSPSFQWYKGGVLISGATSSALNISTTGNYMCEVTSGISPNCKIQVPHTVNAPSATFTIQRTVPGGNTLQIFPLSAASDYNSFQWYKDGDMISGANSTTYIAPTTGYYQIVAKACGPNGKPYYSTDVIKVNNTCAVPGGATTLTGQINGVQNYSGNIEITGSIYVQPGATLNFTNAQVYITGTCTEIVIEPNGIINATNTQFKSCNYWKGITVKGGAPANGFLNFISGNNSVSDAVIGVYSKDGGRLYINTTTFDNNQTHVAIGPYGPAAHINSFTGVWFKNLAPIIPLSGCTTPYANATNNWRQMYINSIEDASFIDNTFEGKTGPVAEKNGLDCYSMKDLSLAATVFQGQLFKGVYMESCQTQTVTGCFFGTGGGISPIDKPKSGIVMKDVTGSNIEGCTFNNTINGVEFYQTNNLAAVTTIYKNRFENNTYGVVAAPSEYPVTSSSSSCSPTMNTATGTIQLDINCNKFFYNTVGIIGSGALRQQGTSTAPTTNNFNNNAAPSYTACATCNTSLNGTDILWDAKIASLPVNWYLYSDPTNLLDPIPNPSVTGPSRSLNCSTVSTLMNVTAIYSSANGNCFKSWKYFTGIDDMENKQDAGIKVYPNPFENNFTVELSEPCDKIEVKDILGRCIFTQECSNTVKMNINAANWKPGVYLLRVTGKNSTVTHSSIVKE